MCLPLYFSPDLREQAYAATQKEVNMNGMLLKSNEYFFSKDEKLFTYKTTLRIPSSIYYYYHMILTITPGTCVHFHVIHLDDYPSSLLFIYHFFFPSLCLHDNVSCFIELFVLYLLSSTTSKAGYYTQVQLYCQDLLGSLSGAESIKSFLIQFIRIPL